MSAHMARSGPADLAVAGRDPDQRSDSRWKVSIDLTVGRAAQDCPVRGVGAGANGGGAPGDRTVRAPRAARGLGGRTSGREGGGGRGQRAAGGDLFEERRRRGGVMEPLVQRGVLRTLSTYAVRQWLFRLRERRGYIIRSPGIPSRGEPCGAVPVEGPAWSPRDGDRDRAGSAGTDGLQTRRRVARRAGAGADRPVVDIGGRTLNTMRRRGSPTVVFVSGRTAPCTCGPRPSAASRRSRAPAGTTAPTQGGATRAGPSMGRPGAQDLHR